jgi:cytochrome c peroxidase
MVDPAQGADGFNVPSLFGLSVGAPYLHAGNARTLEELFAHEFAAHHQGPLADDEFLSSPTNRADQVSLLVSFLLSIDESAPLEPVPSELDFCVSD